MFANGFRRIALARGLLPEAEPRPPAAEDRPAPADTPAPEPCEKQEDAG